MIIYLPWERGTLVHDRILHQEGARLAESGSNDDSVTDLDWMQLVDSYCTLDSLRVNHNP